MQGTMALLSQNFFHTEEARPIHHAPSPVSVSLEAGLRHLLLLSNHRCAQHQVFVLMAFDEIARTRSDRNLAVKMKVNPKTAIEVLHISAEALTKLLYHNQRRSGECSTSRASCTSIRRHGRPQRSQEHLEFTKALFWKNIRDQ